MHAGASRHPDAESPVGTHLVSLRYATDALSSCPPAWTVQDFVVNIILPRTAARKEADVERLRREEPLQTTTTAAKSDSTIFVSYVRSYTCQAVAHVCRELIIKCADTWIWMDVFCVNLHHNGQADDDDARAALTVRYVLTNVLDAMGSTLAILQGWPRPRYVQRLWCLMELATSARKRIPITIHVPPSEMHGINALSKQEVCELMDSIHVLAARASHAPYARTLLDVAYMAGIEEVHGHVRGALGTWLADMLVNIDTENMVSRLWIAQAIFVELHQYADALRCVQRIQEHLDDDDDDSLVGRGWPSASELVYEQARCLIELKRPSEAWELLTRAMECQVQQRPPSFARGPDVGHVWLQARCLAEMGRFREAVEVQERCVVLTLQVWGGDESHAQVMSCRNQLVTYLDAAGRCVEALAMCDDGLRRTVSAYGANHLAVAERLAKRAEILANLGRHADAMQSQDEALRMQRPVLGLLHPDTCASLLMVARRFRQGQRPEPAMDILHRLTEKVCAPMHGTAWVDELACEVMEEMTTLLVRAGRVVDALGVADRLVDHAVTHRCGEVRAMVVKVEVLRELRHAVEALELILKVRHRLHITDENSSTGLVRRVLGDHALCLRELDRHEEALAVFEQLLAAQVRAFGETEDHEEPATTRMRQSICLIRLGRAEEGLYVASRAMESFERRVGTETSVFAIALGRSGLALKHLGRVDEGAQRIQRAMEILKRVHKGENNEMVSLREEWGM